MSTTRTLGVLLAGGESRRMGRDKHALTLDDGRTFARACLDTLTPFVARTVVVGHARGLPRDGSVSFVDDDAHVAGPLGGVLAALHDARDDEARLLVLACDAPRVSSALLARLLACHDAGARAVACVDGEGRVWPLPCVIDVRAARACVDEIVQVDSPGVVHLLRALAFASCAIDDDARARVQGVNTPEELRALTNP